jgi:hypothetical protein
MGVDTRAHFTYLTCDAMEQDLRKIVDTIKALIYYHNFWLNSQIKRRFKTNTEVD